MSGEGMNGGIRGGSGGAGMGMVGGLGDNVYMCISFYVSLAKSFFLAVSNVWRSLYGWIYDI